MYVADVAGTLLRNVRRTVGMAAPTIVLAVCATAIYGQDPQGTESPSVPPQFEENIVPTFETQRLARTYVLDIPAPRGEIVDRNGTPLAQNRLCHNLAITFPTPLEFSDDQILAYAHDKIQQAEKMLGRPLRISDELIKRHYRNRGILPFEIAQNLADAT